MLTVPVILKKSSIKGNGIFTKRKIKKGSIIIRTGIKERYYSEKQLKRFSPKYKKILNKFAYWDKKDGRLVYPLDATKHLNHSCEPNILNRGNIDIAGRNIKKGEELTYDYRLIMMKNEQFKCNCGSKHCKGLVKA